MNYTSPYCSVLSLKCPQYQTKFPFHSFMPPNFHHLNFIHQKTIDDLHTNTIRHVTPRSLRRSNNFHHLASPHAIVSSNWIIWLNAGELCLTEAVSFEEFLFFILREDKMLWHLYFISTGEGRWDRESSRIVERETIV